MKVRAAIVGASAALRAPLWTSGDRLRSALNAQVDQTVQVQPNPDVVEALRVANGMVRHLSRTRTVWKNTCLYRSAAQYLVLKDFGRSAAIRIGVRDPRHKDETKVEAHSWVLHDGPEKVQDTDMTYEELAFSKSS